MTKPLNIRGDESSIYETTGFPVGTRMHVEGGKVFRASKNGSSALLAAQVIQAAQQLFAFKNLQPVNVTGSRGGRIYYAAGESSIYVGVPNSGASLNVNFFDLGTLYINSGTGSGYQYSIEVSDVFIPGNASNIPSTYLKITLASPLQSALSATSKITILKNKFDSVTIASAPATAEIVGVTPTSVAANAKFWLQTGGPALVLQQDTIYPNFPVTASNDVSGSIGVATIISPRDQGKDLFNISDKEGYIMAKTNVQTATSTVGTVDTPGRISGLGIVPDRVMGYCIDSNNSGEYCLVNLILEQ